MRDPLPGDPVWYLGGRACEVMDPGLPFSDDGRITLHRWLDDGELITCVSGAGATLQRAPVLTRDGAWELELFDGIRTP